MSNIDANHLQNIVKNMQLILLLPVGRGGSIFFQSLLDSHPNISMLPSRHSVYNYYEEVQMFNDPRMQITKFIEKNKRLIDIYYDEYFHKENYSSSPISENELVNIDRYIDNFVYISEQIEIRNNKEFFIALHLSLSMTKDNELTKISHILFHFHDYNLEILRQIKNDFPDLVLVGTTRDPRESYLSWKRLLMSRGYKNIQYHYWLFGEFMQMYYQFLIFANELESSKAILLDLNTFHRDGEKYLQNIMRDIGIDYCESLRHSTLLGVKYFGNSSDNIRADTFSQRMEQLRYPSAISNGELTQFELKLVEYFSQDIIQKFGYKSSAGSESMGSVYLRLITNLSPMIFLQRIDKSFLEPLRKTKFNNILAKILPLNIVRIIAALYAFWFLNLKPAIKEFFKSFLYVYNSFLFVKTYLYVSRYRSKFELNCIVYNNSGKN